MSAALSSQAVELVRSWLYVPGDSERKLTKARGVGADIVIADLEDAVVEERKLLARELVAELLAASWGRTRRYVRVNPVGTPHWRADIEATIGARPDGYVVPKVDGPADVEAVAAHVRDVGGPEGLPALAVIVTETARGVLHAPQSIAASDLVADVHWGAEDLSADVGARVSRDPAGRYVPPFDYVRSQVLMQTKGLGRRAIDAPFLRLGDEQGLAREAAEAASMGFDGKQAIHPDHVAVIHEAFRPSDEEVRRARELVEAFEQSGSGAFRFEGQMVDPPHLKAAQRVLAAAEADAVVGRAPSDAQQVEHRGGE